MSATSRLYAEVPGTCTLKGKVHFDNGTWKADYPQAEVPPPGSFLSPNTTVNSKSTPRPKFPTIELLEEILKKKRL